MDGYMTLHFLTLLWLTFYEYNIFNGSDMKRLRRMSLAFQNNCNII